MFEMVGAMAGGRSVNADDDAGRGRRTVAGSPVVGWADRVAGDRDTRHDVVRRVAVHDDPRLPRIADRVTGHLHVADGRTGRCRRHHDVTQVRPRLLEDPDVTGDRVARDGHIRQRTTGIVRGEDDAAVAVVARNRVVGARCRCRSDTGWLGPGLGAPGSVGPLSLTKTAPSSIVDDHVARDRARVDACEHDPSEGTDGAVRLHAVVLNRVALDGQSLSVSAAKMPVSFAPLIVTASEAAVPPIVTPVTPGPT